MLSLSDFQQKQILFIKTENNAENKIRFYNDNIVFEKNEKIENRASCHKVFAVFIIGHLSLTTELIRKGLEHGISFFFLNNDFKCYAFINSLFTGNYLLRQKQYLLTEEEILVISKNIVLNKIKNQYKLLRLKHQKISKDLNEIIKDINEAKDIAILRGIEGNISKDYFKEYFKEIGWFARLPRVKPDLSNFLLDMGYTFLFNFLDALLNLFGFDSYKGCYHQLFFQRKSLVCDMMEPFRCLIDREVLKMFNLKIANENDFKIKDGKVEISYKNSQKYALQFFEAIMKNKNEIYKYILDFYHFMMDKNKYPFPYFEMK